MMTSHARQEYHHIAKVMSSVVIRTQCGTTTVAMSLCSLIYNNNQGISSVNGLIEITNILVCLN